GIAYGFRETEQIAQAVIAKRAQRHDQTVRRDCGDDAGGKRPMAVSRIETIEVGGVRVVQKAGVGLVEKSGIRLVQETRIRLIKKSGIRLVQKCRYAWIAGDKVVSAGQMTGQRRVRIIDL